MSKLRHKGGEEVKLRVEGGDFQVRLLVTDVTQPNLSVNSMNEAGARVEFSTAGPTDLPSITRDSQNGQTRLGLKRMFGLFFCCAVEARTMATRSTGRTGLMINTAPVTDVGPFMPEDTEEPMEPAARPERCGDGGTA